MHLAPLVDELDFLWVQAYLSSGCAGSALVGRGWSWRWSGGVELEMEWLELVLRVRWDYPSAQWP